MSQDFAKAAALEAEYAQLEAKLSDPGTHANQAEARRIGKRHAELKPVVAKYRQWRQFGDDEQAAREMGAEDPSFLAEADELAAQRAAAADKLQEMLIPRDWLGHPGSRSRRVRHGRLQGHRYQRES